MSPVGSHNFRKNLLIAIDGPAGSGKSSGARALARKLKIYYLNTGNTFRAVAFNNNKINFEINFNKNGESQIYIGGKNITDKLFSASLGWKASCLATKVSLRKKMIELWRKAAKDKSIVIEGRDIAQVFPKADLKVYMTADIKTRAKRLHLKLEEVLKRDEQDSKRSINPLKFSRNYWVLDTTKLTIKQEVAEIIDKLNE
jgi:cytidylate kinase